MISYQIYKIVHLVGIGMLLMSIAGLIGAAVIKADPKFKGRGFFMASHGLGLFLSLLGGFGLLARLGLTSGLPGWVYAKLAIWLILGLITLVVKKARHLAIPVFYATILFFGLAAYLAGYKPF